MTVSEFVVIRPVVAVSNIAMMNLEFRKSLRRKKTSAAPPPSVERDVNAEINLKGWLYRLEGSPLKHWKKRWCVLTQYALFVYRDEDEQKLLASLLLPGYSVRVCMSQDRVSHKNAFVAEHETLKSYYFAADSNAAMCQWRNSMAQSATIQVSAQEHNHATRSLPHAIYDCNNRQYMDMNTLTCVTRSPIYANAPPKPKRVSPLTNRPHSADFLNYPEELRDKTYTSCSQRQTRPHTSMRFFDPEYEASNNYGPTFRQSTTRNTLLPVAPLRPKSSPAEPAFFSVPFVNTPCNFEVSHALPAAQKVSMYSNFSSPNICIENSHDLHAHPQCHPESMACSSASKGLLRLTTLGRNVSHSRSPPTSASALPLPTVTNKDTLLDPCSSVRARSLHNMANFQNHLDCYDSSQNEARSFAHPMISLNKETMGGASSGSHDAFDSGHDSCLSSLSNVKLCPQSDSLTLSTPTTHNIIDEHAQQHAFAVDNKRFLAPNNNPQDTLKKLPSGRTLSTTSYISTNNAEEIQPSKLEVYRQVPQPSFSTKSADEFLASSRQNQRVNDIMGDHRNFSLQSASSRELQSLQSLTDSQYSTVPPESSLPSLESNSSDFHTPSPVQHFTNIPPHQLRRHNQHHRTSEPRAGPPKYSEACLRSEYVYQVHKISAKQDESSQDTRFPVKLRTMRSPLQSSCQREQYSPVSPRMLVSRKLLYDQINYAHPKALSETNKPEDAYSYGREDLLKASQLFYNSGMNRPVMVMDSQNSVTLDLSFQSSSHNSVFEHDPSVDRHEQYKTAEQPRPILAQVDSANYAILKQEIEGSKVVARSAAVLRSASPSFAHDREPPLYSESVSSSASRDSRGSQSSVVRTAIMTELDKFDDIQSPNKRLSSTDQATKTLEKAVSHQGIVSEKLAFFESKKSPELSRPKSTLSNGSGSSIATTRPIPDLIDELRELGSRSCNRISTNSYICSASSEDILRTITNSKHQRNLSLLEGPAPDVVPAQTPPYYYSDLSLSAKSSIALDHHPVKIKKQATSASQISHLASKDFNKQSKPLKLDGSHKLSELHSQKLLPLLQKADELNGVRAGTYVFYSTESSTSRAQSLSCENLLKKQLVEVPEVTQSATCLLESEPFYENIGFGCKGSAVHGSEPQSSTTKVPFLVVSPAGMQKTVSVDEHQLSWSSHSLLGLPANTKIEQDNQSCCLPQDTPTNRRRTQEWSDSRRDKKCYRNLVTTRNRRCDEDLEELNALGPPDVIQSALNSSGDAGEHDNEIFEQIINSISYPSKIDIPERYVSESDSDVDFSAVERLARYHKADIIRRRLAGHSRDHASRLTMNQVIAKQAKHISKIVATHH